MKNTLGFSDDFLESISHRLLQSIVRCIDMPVPQGIIHLSLSQAIIFTLHANCCVNMITGLSELSELCFTNRF